MASIAAPVQWVTVLFQLVLESLDTALVPIVSSQIELNSDYFVYITYLDRFINYCFINCCIIFLNAGIFYIHFSVTQTENKVAYITFMAKYFLL